MDLVELNELEAKRHPWELARLEVVYGMLQKLIQKMDKPLIRILDVGAGDAYFIREICRRIPQAEAIAVDIEYSSEMLENLKKANSELEERVRYAKNLEDVPKQDYDFVILLDVIEHVEDVKGIFSDIFKRLNQDAHFIVTVPAFQKLFCSHDVFLKHYRRYNTTLLEKHLEESNIKVLHKGYFFFSLLLPRILQLLKEKLGSKTNLEDNGIGQWDKPSGISYVISKILQSDARISKMLGLPGLSAYAIAKSNIKER